ncbi:YHS domain-containing protein [Pedobacter yonginense]|nr:YHS domain-containing protein [Pedobacter yonginense]
MKKISFLITAIIFIAFLSQSSANITVAHTLALPTDSIQKVEVDLVCKMKVKPTSSKSTVYNKKTYYFCSESCKQKFVAKPTNYVKNK